MTYARLKPIRGGHASDSGSSQVMATGLQPVNRQRRATAGFKPKTQPGRSPGNAAWKRKSFKKPTSRRYPRGKKAAVQLPKGVVHIQSSFNNTIVTVTNLRGRVIAWSSAGANGFKGARKSTPFAAKIAAKAAGRASFDQGLKLVKVMVKGGGSGRETAMRGLIDAGLQLAVIRDITGVPHNGCRPPKKRRV